MKRLFSKFPCVFLKNLNERMIMQRIKWTGKQTDRQTNERTYPYFNFYVIGLKGI